MIFLEENELNKYIKSKKKSTNYLGASAVVATVLISPLMLNAQTVLPDVDVTEKTQKVDYTQTYKVEKSSSSKVTQDLVDTPQTIQVITNKVIQEQQATTLQEALRNTPGVTLLLGENGNTNTKNNIDDIFTNSLDYLVKKLEIASRFKT